MIYEIGSNKTKNIIHVSNLKVNICNYVLIIELFYNMLPTIFKAAYKNMQ